MVGWLHCFWPELRQNNMLEKKGKKKQRCSPHSSQETEGDRVRNALWNLLPPTSPAS
jgi:hypothetical protein